MRSIEFLSIVIPVYNEAQGIAHFYEILEETVNDLSIPKYETIFVNDGSTDNTTAELKKISDKNKNVRIIELTRNFGKEPALSAGLHNVRGDCVVVLDADGQHPPAKIKDLLEGYREGYDMVVGLRQVNDDEKAFKKLGNKAYYWMLKATGTSYLQPRVTDFRAMSREAVDTFCRLTERRRITRGLLDWMGYPTKYVEFKSPQRLAGSATYSTKKLIILAVDSILSSSRKPLYVSIMLGGLITSISLLLLLAVLAEKYLLSNSAKITGAGVVSIFIAFMVGLVFVSQGILALYLARTYEESQQRPLYIIRKSKSDLTQATEN